MAFESNITATNISGSDSTKAIWNYGSAPGVDPHGYIAQWLGKIETATQNTINAVPSGSSTYQANYDGMYCYWRMAELTANSTLATDAKNYAMTTGDACATTWPDLDTVGPTDSFTGAVPTGFASYNGGFRTIAEDPIMPPGEYDLFRQRCCNWARGAAYSNAFGRIGYCKRWSEGLWPNDPNYWPEDWATNPPYECRERALSMLNHMISDDWFADFEQRVYEGYPLLGSHDEFIAAIAENWFCYPGGALDQWVDITNELNAAGGNFDLVPRTWRSSRYEYTPFMWAHSFRALIYHLEEGQRMGTKDIEASIVDALRVLCDTSIEYWRVPLSGHPGYYGLAYEVNEGSPPTEAAGDLALFHMPMFAYLYSKTGDSRYYNMAVELVECGLEFNFFPNGKQTNQQSLWAYAGFQWLGWTSEPFAVWWRDNP